MSTKSQSTQQLHRCWHKGVAVSMSTLTPSPSFGVEVNGREELAAEALPEGTAAVPKDTEPNMSALAGSVWDEDGIKASPGVAGVCGAERGRDQVNPDEKRQ